MINQVLLINTINYLKSLGDTMRALIIGSGIVYNDSIQKNLKPGDIIICCDGGSKYLFEEGVIPHYIIGDLDSSIPQIIQFYKTRNVIFKKTIIDKNNIINLISSNIEIKGKKGDLVSLIPITTSVEGISTIGLEYPLKNATMHIGKSLGVSNVMEDGIANVSIEKGYLLVMKCND